MVGAERGGDRNGVDHPIGSFATGATTVSPASDRRFRNVVTSISPEGACPGTGRSSWPSRSSPGPGRRIASGVAEQGMNAEASHRAAATEGRSRFLPFRLRCWRANSGTGNGTAVGGCRRGGRRRRDVLGIANGQRRFVAADGGGIGAGGGDRRSDDLPAAAAVHSDDDRRGRHFSGRCPGDLPGSDAGRGLVPVSTRDRACAAYPSRGRGADRRVRCSGAGYRRTGGCARPWRAQG